MSSAKKSCRPAAEVIEDLMKLYNIPLQTLCVKLEINEFTCRRFYDGPYKAYTSYPTLMQKVSFAFKDLPANFFDPDFKRPEGTVPTGTPAPVPATPTIKQDKPAPAKEEKKEPAPAIKQEEKKQKPIPEKSAMQIELERKQKEIEDAQKAQKGTKVGSDGYPVFNEKPTPMPKKPEPEKPKAAPAAEPKPAKPEPAPQAVPSKPLNYDQLSAKLSNEICTAVKTALNDLKESHKESLPKEPVYQSKEAAKLASMIPTLDAGAIKLLLDMAKRITGTP